MRKFTFQTGDYYHLYNRGVDRRNIFIDNGDYFRFLNSMKEFNDTKPVVSLYLRRKAGQLRQQRGLAPFKGAKPLIEIIAYNLLPNHFHFILKQLVNGGLSEFMKRLGGGYTGYFNNKYNRTGSLFEGTFKSIQIITNEYLLWLSAYVNGNADIHRIAKIENWHWSSYKDYLELRPGTLCNKKVILCQFKNIKEYKNLVETVIRDSKERKNEIKKYLLE